MERLESYAKQAIARNIKAEIFQNLGDAGRTTDGVSNHR